MDQDLLLEGNISVKAALLAKVRTVCEVIVDEHKNDKDTRYILAKAYEAGVEVKKVSRDAIDDIAEGKTHGGLIARVSERRYQSLADVINLSNPF